MVQARIRGYLARNFGARKSANVAGGSNPSNITLSTNTELSSSDQQQKESDIRTVALPAETDSISGSSPVVAVTSDSEPGEHEEAAVHIQAQVRGWFARQQSEQEKRDGFGQIIGKRIDLDSPSASFYLSVGETLGGIRIDEHDRIMTVSDKKTLYFDEVEDADEQPDVSGGQICESPGDYQVH